MSDSAELGTFLLPNHQFKNEFVSKFTCPLFDPPPNVLCENVEMYNREKIRHRLASLQCGNRTLNLTFLLTHQGVQAVYITYRDHVQAEIPLVEGSERCSRH